MDGKVTAFEGSSSRGRWEVTTGNKQEFCSMLALILIGLSVVLRSRALRSFHQSISTGGSVCELHKLSAYAKSYSILGKNLSQRS
jgi:hypothetical protein